MSNFTLNIPITKVDEEQRIVYGYATVEELDRQGDIVDYEASKKAFSKWAGNIREQHDSKRAVGKNVHMEFDDDDKRVLIGAKISRSADGDNAWTKVQEGILTGFSIGGKIYKTIRDTIKSDDGEEVTANRITDYDLAEVSLVDVPACPSAQFVMVKSLDGRTEEVEEMHEAEQEPWFFKHFAYSVNQFPVSSDTISMKKRDYSDDERKQMADSGEAMPDGSFPIKTVADLKNAIKAYGRAKDQAKAKAHIIKRAKALGRTDLLPEDWNVKGVEVEMTKQEDKAAEVELEKVNVAGGEERDSEANVVTEATPGTPANTEAVVEGAAEAPVAEEPVEETPAPKKKKSDETVEAKVEEPEVKKGLYTVAQLAECVENLTYIVQSAEFEAQFEGDNSPVPGQLKTAVAQVGACLVAMAQEEVNEAAQGDDTDVELATEPADLLKAVDLKLEATKDDLTKSVVEAVSAKVAEQLKPLEERLTTIENQPVGQAPVRQYTVVDKVADNAVEPDELTKLLAKAESLPETATVAERAELAGQIMTLKSRQRPIPAISIN